MNSSRSKKLLACFLLVTILSTQNTSARIAGWEELKDNIAFIKRKECTKSDELAICEELVNEINDFLKNIESCKINYGYEYIFCQFAKICNKLYNHLLTIKFNRRSKNYSTLYQKIIEKRYEIDNEKTEKKENLSTKNENIVDLKIKDEFDESFTDDENKNKLNINNFDNNDQNNINNFYDKNKYDKIKAIAIEAKNKNKSSSDPDYFDAYIEVDIKNEDENELDITNSEDYECNKTNNQATNCENHKENVELIDNSKNNVELIDNSKNIENYFRVKQDIIEVFPKNIQENQKYSLEEKFNILMKWIKRVSNDIIGGHCTVWGASIRDALKNLSDLELNFNNETNSSYFENTSTNVTRNSANLNQNPNKSIPIQNDFENKKLNVKLENNFFLSSYDNGKIKGVRFRLTPEKFEKFLKCVSHNGTFVKINVNKEFIEASDNVNKKFIEVSDIVLLDFNSVSNCSNVAAKSSIIDAFKDENSKITFVNIPNLGPVFLIE